MDDCSGSLESRTPTWHPQLRKLHAGRVGLGQKLFVDLQDLLKRGELRV
jgi:hypothetical protein